MARAVQLDYIALALTDECSSPAWCAPMSRRKSGLPLMIGGHFHLQNEDGSPAFSLILLAQNREGYGNLSELITLARTRADKGSYRLTPDDLAAPELPTHTSPAAGLPGDPDAGVWRRRRPFARRHNGWRCMFPNAPGSALSCCTAPAMNGIAPRSNKPPAQRPPDRRRRRRLHACALAQAAAGHADRDPLRQAAGGCGYELAPNAEQHLRSRLRLANLYPPRRWPKRCGSHNAATFRWTNCATSTRRKWCRPACTPAVICAQVKLGAHERWPAGIPATIQQRIDLELSLIEEIAVRILFSHRVRHRAVRAQPRHPVSGPRFGGQFGGLLLPRHYRSVAASRHIAVRALYFERAQRTARYRCRFRARAPRRSHPVHLQKIRARTRRARRHGDQLSHAQRDSRYRQSARLSTRRLVDQIAKSLAWWEPGRICSIALPNAV